MQKKNDLIFKVLTKKSFYIEISFFYDEFIDSKKQLFINLFFSIKKFIEYSNF